MSEDKNQDKLADISQFEAIQEQAQSQKPMVGGEVFITNWKPENGLQTHLPLTIKLNSPEGNIFAIIAKGVATMRKAKIDRDFIELFQEAVRESGNYDMALKTVSEFFETTYIGKDDPYEM